MVYILLNFIKDFLIGVFWNSFTENSALHENIFYYNCTTTVCSLLLNKKNSTRDTFPEWMNEKEIDAQKGMDSFKTSLFL